jgi:hypothetical protein
MSRPKDARWGWLVSASERVPALRSEAEQALRDEYKTLRLNGREAVWEADDDTVADVLSWLEAAEEDYHDGLYRRRR